ELAELDGHRASVGAALQHRNREFTADQETRFMSVARHQIRLGENLQDVLALQSLNGSGETSNRIDPEDIQRPGDFRLGSIWLLAKTDLAINSRWAKLTGRAANNRLLSGQCHKIDSVLRQPGAIELRELNPQQNLPVDRPAGDAEVAHDGLSER